MDYKSYKELKGYLWAKDVISGKFKANKYVILECSRYVNRLENLQQQEDFKFYFDINEANIVYGLTSLINYSTGFYANEPVFNHLAGFQCFVIENVFCWFSKEKDENGLITKMVEEVYLEVGRKSGKSFLTALLEILIMLRSERFAQHAIGGKTREIAGIVKRETEQLIKASPLLAKYFKLTRDRLTCLINDCFMKALSGEANNINGLLLTSYIVDEVANQETQDIIGALKLSQMSVRGSRLAIYISTQYDLEHNAFNELIDYHKKCLDGAVELPDNILSLLFELDEGDDFTDESNWIKASPLQMTFENGRQFLRGEFKKGLEVPTTMREFRIKILNERISGVATESFLPLQDIQKGRTKDDDFDWQGKEVYIGVDLSQTTDNTAVAMVYYDKIKEEFYSKVWAFIPEDSVQQKSKLEKIPYRTFIDQKYCYACGDRVISYKFVEDFVLNLESEYGVTIKGIGYDRFNCVSSANKWSDRGYTTIEVKQHSTILNGGTKLLKESILQNRFFYMTNRLLEINFANVRTMYDTNMNQYIHKKKSSGKIDMVAALLNAMVLWNFEIEEGESIYESRDLIVL